MASTASIDDLIGPPRLAVTRALTDCLDAAAMPAALDAAIRYSLLDGGKMLRPVLCWHCCAATGADPAACLPAAAAVELVHAFSLVHDDLPAMDDDDLRRGKPTLHIHAGEAMAILAGDAMLALAFDCLRRAPLPAETRLDLIAELSAGTSGMIAGQVHDTLGSFEPDLPPLARLERIHRLKTGALLRATCRMGILAGAGSHDLLAAATDYADAVGLMYQIVDDLIDVQQPAEHTGKRTGKDHHAGKLTYPGVLGLERSIAETQRLLAAARAAACRLPANARALERLAEFLAARTR